MATIPLALALQSNPGRYPQASTSRQINCYAEPLGDDGKVKLAVYAAAGLGSFATLTGGGPIRAMLPVGSYLYVVAGRLLFRVDPGGAALQIGGIPTSGAVTMARNRAEPLPEIGIVSDGLYYVCQGTTLTQITDADLPPASSIASLDGYFILPGFGGLWYITTTPDDATQIDALDFAKAESNPDAIVRAFSRETELVLLGAESTEWWQDTGGTFPFSRVQAASIGCLSAASVARVERTVAWVAHDRSVRLMEGYGGKRISTPPVERTIAAETNQAAIRGTSWTEPGHVFYALSGTDWTWVYDAITDLWHERQSYGSGRWRVSEVVEFAGKRIAGDAETGLLYELDRDACDEVGNPLVITNDTPIVHVAPNRLQIDRLLLDVVMGVGLVPGDATTEDPEVTISMSRDSGVTFGAERACKIGKDGQRRGRISERRWGVVEQQGAVFRLSASAAVARGFLSGALEAQKLRL